MLINAALFTLFLSSVLAETKSFQHVKYKSPESSQHIIPGRYMIEYQSDFSHQNTLNNQFQSLQYGEPLYKATTKTHIQTVRIDNTPSHDNFLQTLVDDQHIVSVYPVTFIARPHALSNGYYSRIDRNVTATIQAHQLTQVDRLHKELGLTGKGVKVCIIDTGVDFNHPALGGGFGPGYRIELGQDLVGDTYDPLATNNTVPAKGTPPLDACGDLIEKSGGHGTHVTGIIAGVDADKGFTGVAPNATIGVWRVFGCEGGSSSDIIMKAMVEAQQAKCDVINMSLGNNAPWSEQPHAAFAQELSDQGISVIVSNGNDGENGAFTVTDPAGASDVVSVASVSNSFFLGSLFSLKTSSDTSFGPYSYQVAPEAKTDIPDADIVLGGNPNTFSACESDTVFGQGQYLQGKLALVHQGPCTIVEQANRLAVAGAAGLVYFNTMENDPVRVPYRNASIPIATISSVSGHHLISILKNIGKDKVHMHFERNAFVFESALAESVSLFSSMGPTNELDLKPSVAAIGGNVFSTLPTYMGGWGTRSGTSMASPYVAGTIALLREAFAGQSILPSVLHEKLQNYGRQLNTVKQKHVLESPLRQGSGLLQAYHAIKEPLHVSPAKISFNDTRSATDVYKSHSLKVTNTGAEDVEYTIDTVSAGTIAPYGRNNDAYKLIASSSDRFYVDYNVTVSVEPSLVKLQAGESAQVVVSVKLPSDYNEKEQLLYGGYVEFRHADGRDAQVHVPYFGVLGSLYDLPTMDPKTLNIKDSQGRTYTEKDTFQFSLSDKASAPAIGFRLATPSRRFTIDLIDAEEKHVGYIVPTYNYAERDLDSSKMEELNPWTGNLVKDDNVNSKAVRVSPGTYKVRWSALRMFGDVDVEKDWVVQISGPIIITP
ncbi:hypothetical protein INT48_009527 [Thamnidium elegans]|uniref:Uncharacterized protein n=1 Tax=Thamnidium elegans TaxID=101142 RepID=A0A8H7W3P2_9FUNG|nr:hypothetical protein INT48_009527 [Thamnidium elegans]